MASQELIASESGRPNSSCACIQKPAISCCKPPSCTFPHQLHSFCQPNFQPLCGAAYPFGHFAMPPACFYQINPWFLQGFGCSCSCNYSSCCRNPQPKICECKVEKKEEKEQEDKKEDEKTDEGEDGGNDKEAEGEEKDAEDDEEE